MENGKVRLEEVADMKPEKFVLEKEREIEDSFMSGEMFPCFNDFKMYGVEMKKLKLSDIASGREEEIKLGRLPHNLKDNQVLVQCITPTIAHAEVYIVYIKNDKELVLIRQSFEYKGDQR